MRTVIFKSEKKAKVYRILSIANQGCFKENELMEVVKTDDITKISNDFYKTKAVLVD